MEEKQCCNELYGGDPCVFADAVKSIENRREFIKKAVKPAEDASKDLKDATATEKVRLQGTAETEAPKLKPYTESIHVRDRKELGTLIESAKKENRPWKVERSRKEGFRYVFVTKVLEEEKLPKGATLKKDAGNVPLNVAHFNHVMGGGDSAGGEGACCGEGLEDKKELELDLEVAPSEEVMPKDGEVKEDKPELTMAEVFTKYFDMKGNEDHSITICLKGCEDKEDCPCITTEPLSDEEYELLKGEFHEEEVIEEGKDENKENRDELLKQIQNRPSDSSHKLEGEDILLYNISSDKDTYIDPVTLKNSPRILNKNYKKPKKEEVVEESLKEEDEKFPNPEKNKLVDTYKGVDIYDCTCGKFVVMINGEKIKKETIDEIKKCIDGKCESLTEDEHKEETTIEADKVETTKCEDGECKEKTEIFTELPDFDVEVEQKGDKVEVEITPKEKEEVITDLELIKDESLKEDKGVSFYWVLEDEKGNKAGANWSTGDETDIIKFTSKEDANEYAEDNELDVLGFKPVEYTHDTIEEASSAEKRAYKFGGQDYTDLLVGKTIARLKDPKAREAAVAAIKAGRPEVARKEFEGDRKEMQADMAIQSKMQKMQNAGIQDESLTEQLLVEEDAVVDDNVEIKLDDLQYFKPVAGARDTWDLIIKNNKLGELAKVLSDFAKDGKMTTTDLNDILWFEKEWIIDKLHIESVNPDIKTGDDVIDVEVKEKEEEE